MSLTHVARRSVHWTRAIVDHPANQGARAAALGRAARWHWRTRAGRDAEAVVTVDGRTQVIVRPHQFSAVWTLYDGVHEWEELQFCLSYLRPGDHFVDIGANVGVFSAFVGTRIDGVAITAIEPFTPTRAVLDQTLALNGLDVEVVGDAVGAEAGAMALEVHERDVLNRLAPVGTDHDGPTVEVRTLDALLAGRVPALIKIDVEGSELDVLRGARSTLAAAAPPTLLFEHCGHGAAFGITPADIQAFLRDIGFSMFLLDGALSPWDGDEQPPTPNVVATADIAGVRARLASGEGAPVRAPVRVEERYRSPAAG